MVGIETVEVIKQEECLASRCNNLFYNEAPPPPSAADLASSFLNSVGQELHGSNENPYGHESQGNGTYIKIQTKFYLLLL